MLKMKCSSCEKEIRSPLLAEIGSISCPHCRMDTPVNDIIVSAQGYSYHRDDLIKRQFRYKTLIAEVTKERELLENSPASSAESIKSLDRFLATLEEMMAGARDHLRIEFDRHMPVAYKTKQLSSSGRLLNLSMQGACLEVEGGNQLPKKKAAIALRLSLPGEQDSVILNGTVAWIKKSLKKKNPYPLIGVNFTPLDQDVHAVLWAFISHSVTVS
jgi:hypothetical protein